MFLDSDKIDELDTSDFLVERAAERLVRDPGDMQAWMTDEETGPLDIFVTLDGAKMTLERALLNALAYNPYLRSLRTATVEALTQSKALSLIVIPSTF